MVSASLEQGSIGEFTIESTRTAFETDEWEECVDDNGKTFYYNTATGVSTWQDPRTLAITDGSGSAATEAESQGEGVGRGDDREDLDMQSAATSGPWEEVVDDDGTRYYYNADTGESTYDRPDGLSRGDEPQAEALDDAAQGTWDDPMAQEPIVDANGGVWEQTDDGEGNAYWYNTETGESSWEPPR